MISYLSQLVNIIMSSDEEFPFAAPQKRGLKRGNTVTNNKTSEDWYLACTAFAEVKKKKLNLSCGSFLDSDATDSRFENTK